MRISERGTRYSSNIPTLEVTEAEICGKYPTQNSGSSYVRHIPVPPLVLMERRVAKHTAPSPVMEMKHQPSSSNFPRTQSPKVETFMPVETREVATQALTKTWAVRQNSKKVIDEVTLNHQANIRRTLDHRLRVAQTKGDLNLLRLLEAELKQMSFSA